MYTIRACIFFKTFSASLGTGLFLDKVVSTQQWAPFRHTQGLPLELRRETDFTYQSKEVGGGGGEKGPSSGESGPSGTMNRFEWSIRGFFTPPLLTIKEGPGGVGREGRCLYYFFFFFFFFFKTCLPLYGDWSMVPQPGPEIIRL